MKRKTGKKLCIVGLIMLFMGIGPAWLLAEPETGADGGTASGAVVHEKAGGAANWSIGIGAGLAIGLAALATGIAQARIGAAGMGGIAENPKLTGTVILCIAIPETMVILGFVVAYLLISS